MSLKRRMSKHQMDYPGYIGHFSRNHSLADTDLDTKYSKNWEPPADYQESVDLEKKWPEEDENFKHHTSGSNSDQCDSDGNPRTMKRVLTRFAERTSMQGVPYIHISKTWYAKLLWTLFFCAALAGMVVHLSVLCQSYLAFAKQTKIQLGFDNIKFPTITICNVNPVRSSKLYMATKELRGFIKTIKPENVASSIREVVKGKRRQGRLDDVTSEGTHGRDRETNVNIRKGNKKGRKKNNPPPLAPPPPTDQPPNPPPSTQSDPPPDNSSPTPTTTQDSAPAGQPASTPPPPSGGSNPPPPGGNNPPPPPGRKKRFIDDVEFNFTDTRLELEHGKRGKRPSGPKSNIHQIQREFKYLYSSHDRGTRISLGHELEDMLVSCTFAGYVCNASHFTIHPTSTFGNCYTLENADYISYKSGPTDGVELIFFLETDEYIHTIASGTGAQLQIHDTNTWPDPEGEGLALSAAMETNIAMRMIQIERLNWPNDDCEYGTEFEAKYGRKYTRQACHLFCIQERIVSECGCFDEEKYELQSNINTDVKGGKIPPCRQRKDVLCMLEVEGDWEIGEFQCPCKNPCSETGFQKISTSRLWPSDAYAQILVEYICTTRNETECEKYEQMSKRSLSQNFMKINIFFEDLNYELISEARDYEDVQFASDVGGTVGLWVGLSILSLMEVFQFFTEIFQFLFCRKHGRKSKVNQDMADINNGTNDNRVLHLQRK